MTDPVIPDEAIAVAARGLFYARYRLAWDNPWLDEAKHLSAQQEATASATYVLEAALPHLRAQGCAKSDQICGDCNALPGRDHSPSCVTNIEGVKALIATATKLGRQLGRQEMLCEVLDRLTTDGGINLGAVQRALRGSGPACGCEEEEPGLLTVDPECARHSAEWQARQRARDVATRTADARTDPSGHTGLPPTPDAGSKRLPEEGDEWCCGTCQRIAWEANPMSREEQSTEETP